MKKVLRICSIALVLVLSAGISKGATNYYSIGNGDFLMTPWSYTGHAGPNCGCNPDANNACDIIIPANATVYIAHTITTTCDITIGSNATVVIVAGGNLIVAGDGGINGTGNFQVNAGGQVNVSGDFNITGTGTAIVNGTMNVDGTLSIAGTASLCGSGNVNVGGLSGNPCATIVLPIELLSFDAVNMGANVQINWTTATEINNAYFTVERSSNGLDFIEIGRLDGALNSSQMIDYLMLDNDPLPGTSYYRLKQTDINGTYRYFDMVAVKRLDCTPVMSAFPNPAQEGSQIFLSFTGFGDEEVLVVVRDITGKEFYSKVILMKQGNQIIAFDPDQKIPAGTYVIVATSADDVLSMKIIVQ